MFKHEKNNLKEAIRALEEAEIRLGLKKCKAKRVKAFGW